MVRRSAVNTGDYPSHTASVVGVRIKVESSPLSHTFDQNWNKQTSLGLTAPGCY